MEKKSFSRKLIAVSLTIMLLVLVFLGVYYYVANQPKMMYPGEIRNYQGQNLASIADVKENAIKGTQYINVVNLPFNDNGVSKQNR